MKKLTKTQKKQLQGLIGKAFRIMVYGKYLKGKKVVPIPDNFAQALFTAEEIDEKQLLVRCTTDMEKPPEVWIRIRDLVAIEEAPHDERFLECMKRAVKSAETVKKPGNYYRDDNGFMSKSEWTPCGARNLPDNAHSFPGQLILTGRHSSFIQAFGKPDVKCPLDQRDSYEMGANYSCGYRCYIQSRDVISYDYPRVVKPAPIIKRLKAGIKTFEKKIEARKKKAAAA